MRPPPLPSAAGQTDLANGQRDRGERNEPIGIVRPVLLPAKRQMYAHSHCRDCHKSCRCCHILCRCCHFPCHPPCHFCRDLALSHAPTSHKSPSLRIHTPKSGKNGNVDHPSQLCHIGLPLACMPGSLPYLPSSPPGLPLACMPGGLLHPPSSPSDHPRPHAGNLPTPTSQPCSRPAAMLAATSPWPAAAPRNRPLCRASRRVYHASVSR